MFSRALGGIGRILIVAGLVILGFVAYQLWGTGLEESRQQDQLLQDYASDLGGSVGDTAGEVAALAPRNEAEPGPPPTPAEGDPAAIIQIPKLDLSRVVVEGTSRAELKKGPGHYIGTPFPGQAGNVGIAGHRTTYGAPFNRIDELVPGDTVVLSTSQGHFIYRVIPAPGSDSQAWYTVKPSQVEVLADMGDNRVTLTACHPKYSARQRIIVHAVLEDLPAAPSPDLSDSAGTNTGEQFGEGLGSTPEELPLAVGFGVAAALLAIAAWIFSANMARRRWIAWVVIAPVAMVLLWSCYVHLDRYLPAI